MPDCRLYCKDLALGPLSLPEEEAHHAVTVRRLKAGDEVVVFDGAGREGLGRLTVLKRRSAGAEIERIVERPFDLAHKLTLAVAMPKAQRAGYLIEKCTELGVAAVWPILTGRSVARPGASTIDKWFRRAAEAAKQSRRAWIPAIREPMEFAQAIQAAGEFHSTYFADLGDSAAPWSLIVAALPQECSILVWIGPEGGWTPAEREAATRAGSAPVRLGPTILRTETAAIAACAAVATVSPCAHSDHT